MEIKIAIPDFEDVRALVRLTQSLDYDIQLVSGKYEVDAKSIMSIFTLDLNQPVLLKAKGKDDPKLLQALSPYIGFSQDGVLIRPIGSVI